MKLRQIRNKTSKHFRLHPVKNAGVIQDLFIEVEDIFPDEYADEGSVYLCFTSDLHYKKNKKIKRKACWYYVPSYCWPKGWPGQDPDYPDHTESLVDQIDIGRGVSFAANDPEAPITVVFYEKHCKLESFVREQFLQKIQMVNHCTVVYQDRRGKMREELAPLIWNFVS
jgi:hypothetical protein